MISLFLFQFRQEYLDTLYRYAKFQYECGNYSGAAEYLYFFRVLVSLVPLISVYSYEISNWGPWILDVHSKLIDLETLFI